MKKVLGSLALFSILATGGMVYAQQEIDACLNFNKAGDYKKAIEAGQSAIKKYPKDSMAYRCLGEAYLKLYIYHYFNKGDIVNGQKFLKLAYKSMEKATSLTNNKEDLMYINKEIGEILDYMGYFDKAVSYYKKSLNLAKGLGNTDMQAYLLKQIAEYYGDTQDPSDWDTALRYYKEFLNYEKDEKAKAEAYNNMGVIYEKLGDYKKAIESYKKAVEIYEKLGDYRKAAIYKHNIGDTYREMKDYKNAEKVFFEALEVFKKLGDKVWEASTYEYLGDLYRDKGDKKTAKEYYARAYNLYKSAGQKGNDEAVLYKIKALDELK
jgi:tetratricopeptide (TPR) repeat protein